MAERTLTLQELNRATLARQMLLQRRDLPIPAAIERLAGLQAQLARPPYLGLWTRLQDFRRQDLARLIECRTVIKATAMRATLHLCTADDYLRFRTTLQPMLTQAWSGPAKRRGADFDVDQVLEDARRFIAEKPRTFAEISQELSRLRPQHDVGAMRYAVRTHLPLVQVPVSSGWGYSNRPQFTLAEPWIGRPLSPDDHLDELVLRYLSAFGPAAATDMQTWSGLPSLKDAFEKLRPKLRSFRDEQGREIFDLPDEPRPDADMPVPVRFLPEFDNLLLSHRNRSRIIADQHRSKVFLPGLRVAATFLINGFVGGTWKVEKKRATATLLLDPFGKLTKPDEEDLSAEGERLLRFVEEKAKSFEVRILL